jgi:hypothetical protein
MIIVNEDTIPVACYDDVSPHEALRAYISEFIVLPNMSDILINREGTSSFEWKGKKYVAVIYLENS